jgi:hypothetical protein
VVQGELKEVHQVASLRRDTASHSTSGSASVSGRLGLCPRVRG